MSPALLVQTQHSHSRVASIDVCILSDDASRLSDASDLSDLSFESGDDSVTLDLQTANCSCTTGLPKFGARDTAAQGGIASRG